MKIIFIMILAVLMFGIAYANDDYSKWCNEFENVDPACHEIQLSAKNEGLGICMKRYFNNQDTSICDECIDKHTKDKITNWCQVLKCIKDTIEKESKMK